MDCSTPGFPVHHQLPELMCIKSVMPSNHLILCRPLLLLPSIFPSIGIFPLSQFFASGGQSTGASALPSVLPVTEFQSSELISFKTDWFDLLAVQGTLSLLQHHGSKASILQSFVWGCIYFETVLTSWVLFLSFIMQAQTAANLVLVIPHNCGQTLLRAPPGDPRVMRFPLWLVGRTPPPSSVSLRTVSSHHFGRLVLS